jgi:integrase
MLTLVTGNTSWDDELAEYQRYCVSGGTAAATVRLRVYYLERFAAYHDANPYTVKIDDLAGFLSATEWAPETRKSARAAMRSFYRWALDTERITLDPTRKLPSVRVPAGKPKPAPENTVAAALARATPQTRLMVMLAAFAGLRCGEIAAVHTDDIVDGSVRIRGKGGRERLVPLHPAILGKLPTEAGWVFPSPYGGHLKPNSVSVILKRVLGPGYSGHTLRHRFATKAYEATHDLRAVQELLGHSKPETTMRYTLVPDDALRAAVWGAYGA